MQHVTRRFRNAALGLLIVLGGFNIALASPTKALRVRVSNHTDSKVVVLANYGIDGNGRTRTTTHAAWRFAPNEVATLAADGSPIVASKFGYYIVTKAGTTPAEIGRVWVAESSKDADYLEIDIRPGRLARPGLATDAVEARRFIEDPDRAKIILRCAHPTAALRSYEYLSCGKTRTWGREDGGVYVTYRFYWKSELFDSNHSTTFTFRFDANGVFTSLDVDHTLTWVPAFSASDMVVGILKDAIRNDPDIQKDPATRRLVEQLLANADAKGLLELVLHLDHHPNRMLVE